MDAFRISRIFLLTLLVACAPLVAQTPTVDTTTVTITYNGSAFPSPQSVHVSNASNVTARISANIQGDGSVASSAGNTPGVFVQNVTPTTTTTASVNIGVDSNVLGTLANRGATTYTGAQLLISATGCNDCVAVAMTLSITTGGSVHITYNGAPIPAAGLQLSAPAFGSTSAQLTLTSTNPTAFTTSSNVTWLTVSPSSGNLQASQILTLQLFANGLPNGPNSATVTVNAGGITTTVPIVFNVGTSSGLTLSFDRAAFLAATSVSTIDFEGIVPLNGSVYYHTFDGVTLSGVNFSGIMASQGGLTQFESLGIIGGLNKDICGAPGCGNSEPYATSVNGTASLIGPSSYNTGDQGNDSRGRLIITLPVPATAVGFDFSTTMCPFPGCTNYPSFDFNVNLTNGDVFTAHAQQTPGFVGVISSTPFTGFYIDLPAPSAIGTTTQLNIDNFSFSATTQSTLPPPALIAPANGASVAGTQTLSWSAPTGATSYDLYLGFTNPPPLVLSNTAATSYSVSVRGATYYWNVVAKNASGSSPASAIRSFTTTDNPLSHPPSRINLSVWRPSEGNWYLNPAISHGPLPVTIPAKQWGLPGDIPVVDGDFNGDGKLAFAVWRPSEGNWYVSLTLSPYPFSGTFLPTRQWGLVGDIPVPGDYDADGKSDYAVWRPSNGTWYIIPSRTGIPVTKQWGLSNDVPIVADFDGDGKVDYAVWRPSQGMWYITDSSTGATVVQQWGLPGDKPVAADFDGDGKADYAVWRPANGSWYIIPSSNPSARYVVQWGLPGDIPVPRDYDGDGKADPAVWRPSNGTWYILPSTAPTSPLVVQWGLPTDVPIAAEVYGVQF